jgi:FimV-like protein
MKSMALSDQLQQILLTCSKEFKIAILYFNQYPMMYGFFILAVLGVIAIIVMSAPQNKAAAVTPPPANKIHSIASSKDITAIAGEDVIATQLDLAKAYIEMDQKNLAKRILNDTLKCGNTAQKNEARQLIETL